MSVGSSWEGDHQFELRIWAYWLISNDTVKDDTLKMIRAVINDGNCAIALALALALASHAAARRPSCGSPVVDLGGQHCAKHKGRRANI